MTDGGGALVGEPHIWRHATLNIVLGNAFVLGVCLLFDVASSRSVLTHLTVGDTDTWGSFVTSLVTGLCVLASMVLLGCTPVDDKQQDAGHTLHMKQHSTTALMTEHGGAQNTTKHTSGHFKMIPGPLPLLKQNKHAAKEESPDGYQGPKWRNTQETDGNKQDAVATDLEITTANNRQQSQREADGVESTLDDLETWPIKGEIRNVQTESETRTDGPSQIPLGYGIDCSSQTDKIILPELHLESTSTMTDEATTADACTGIDTTDHATITTGPFMKKLRRAQRAYRELKVACHREAQVTVTPIRRRMERYSDKMTALQKILRMKSAMAGVTAAARGDSEAEVRGLSRALRNSQDKLDHQLRLNRKLEADIAERSYAPVVAPDN